MSFKKGVVIFEFRIWKLITKYSTALWLDIFSWNFRFAYYSKQTNSDLEKTHYGGHLWSRSNK